MRILDSLGPLAALAVLATPLAAQMPGQSPPPPPQIVTNGEGEAQVTPDRARVHLAVETRGKTAAEAAAENARIQAAVIARLRALGIPAERITTVGYNVQPEYNRARDPQMVEPRVIGYVAHNMVRADVWQMNQVGPVIDAALAAGSNRVGGLDMYSSREDAIRREALANAVAAARADAEAMARAAGGSLGPLLELTSGGFYRPQPASAPMMRAEAMQQADTPIAAGEQTVRANVMARWQFVPGAR
jgi:uncharacterized protein YggE